MSEVKKQDNMQFGAEVGKLLNLVTHAVYTNKDIFLRELISNASDAIEKRRFNAITDPSLSYTDGSKITITLDEKDNTITVRDNGIGMNFEDLVNNLGTIAKSGTEEFVKALQQSQNQKNPELIGQFGIGFYSVFMVAKSVEITTRKAGTDQSFFWTSDGQNGYSIEEIKCNFDPGTEIRILISDEYKSRYIDQHTISFITQSYSGNLDIAIELIMGQKITTLNSGAIWHKDKKDITEEEYKKFYQSISHLPDGPSVTMHYKVEGYPEFIALLFIPTMKPFDLFHPDRLTRVKLYAKKVFISESNLDIIPKYLRFVQGIIDSNDLPLNISRETLQDSELLDRIRKYIVKKAIGELKDVADNKPEEYNNLWNNFGEVIKEGLCDTQDSHDDLLSICRFHSTKTHGDLTSLKEYISRMPEGQDDIFYCVGDNLEELCSEPQLEAFNKAGIEVLLFTQTVDSFWVNVRQEYESKKLKSILSSDIDISKFTKDIEKEKAQPALNKKEEKEMLSSFESALSESVQSVKISHKLIESPACLAVNSGAMSIKMERFLLEQKQIPHSSKKILEINPHSALVKTAYAKLQDENEQSRAMGNDLAHLIFEIACIAQNEPIKHPNVFAKRLVNLLEKQCTQDESIIR